MKLFFHALLTFGCLAVCKAAFPTLYLKPLVLEQFHSPTNITSANDGSRRVFVCDQPGVIYIIKDGMLLPTPFLDISNAAVTVAHRKVIGLGTGYNERGLLGMAFHTGFANPASPGYRKFYLNYNKTYQAGIDPGPLVADHTPNCTTVIAEFQVSAGNADVADALSERKVLLFSQPQSNHNGGQLEFNLNDPGMLYIAIGDGGSADDNNVGHTGGANTNPRPTNALGNGQDKTTFLGKILRINPLDPDGAGPLTYSIPAGNPFVGAGGGVKKEIYAYGLRNPWKFCFDWRGAGTGRMFCCDVGQLRVEEVNIIVSGGNYGWRYMEGNERPTFSSDMTPPAGTLIAPIAEYAHPGAVVGSPALPQLGLSGTGGYVYRGAAIPALVGKYIFGDYGATSGVASGRLMGLEETAPGSGVFTLEQAIPTVGGNPFSARILTLGEDESGEIYLGVKVTAGVLALQTGLPNGGLYKIVPAPAVVNTTTLEPVKDNSIFNDLSVLDEEQSNGAGNLFAGRTGAGNNRRALMKFDVSGIPAGSTIVSATLQMTVNSVDGANPGARNFDLFKLREDWGEAASFNASGPAVALNNDATWSYRFYSDTTPVEWTFATDMPYWFSTSAVTSLNGVGNYIWSHQLFGDVRSWLANPATNFGWILVGNESEIGGTIGTGDAKQFDSRESASAAVRPKLTVMHVPPTVYETWLTTYFPGQKVGTFIDPGGDLDGDGIKNQIEYAYGFSPTSANNGDNFSYTPTSGSGGSTDLTLTFRRDSAALDLTYQLQISGDLSNWTTVAQSVGGATAHGQNGGVVVTDNVLSGSVRLVTVTKNLAAGVNEKQFVRLRVDRVP